MSHKACLPSFLAEQSDLKEYIHKKDGKITVRLDEWVGGVDGVDGEETQSCEERRSSALWHFGGSEYCVSV
jgi:hypothetical protein